MKRHWIRLCIAATCAMGLACGGAEPKGESPYASIQDALSEMDANCIVVVIDAAAAGHSHLYGYPRETTPNLHWLAKTGVLFDRAYSPAPSTVLSVPSYMTGLQPRSFAERLDERRDASLVYLPQAFGAGGFRTGGFSQNVTVELAIPVENVFQYYDGRVRDPRSAAASLLVRRALQWIDGQVPERFFLYLHLLPPHTPYQPPAAHRLYDGPSYAAPVVPDSAGMTRVDSGDLPVTREDVDYIVSQYDANLHFADAVVGRLLAGLTKRGLIDRSVVVVTSDHGEAFGQHGRFLHNTTLYDEMIRVPLVVRLPPALRLAGRRVRGGVGLVDLAPTLEELFGLGSRLARQSEGTSLMPSLVAGTPLESRPIYSQTSDQVAVFQDGWKLIVAADRAEPRMELYDLASDPGEERDRSVAEQERALAMAETVDPLRGGGVALRGLETFVDTLSDEVTSQLEVLGYLLDGAAEEESAAGENGSEDSP